MPSINALPYKIPPKILLYGPAGSGKTALLSTLGKRIEIIATDLNIRTAATFKDKFYDERIQAEFTPCFDTRADIADGFEKAKNRIIQIANLCGAGKYPYQAVGLDSLTTFAEGATKHVLASKGGWGANARTPTQPEWGQIILYCKQLLGILRGLPIPVVVLAHHTVEEQDGVSKARIVSVTRNEGSTLPSFFSEVWYADVTGVGDTRRFQLRTSSSGFVTARSNAQLPNNTDMNLGLPKIMEMIGWKFDDHPVSQPTNVTPPAADASKPPTAPSTTTVNLPAAKK